MSCEKKQINFFPVKMRVTAPTGSGRSHLPSAAFVQPVGAWARDTVGAMGSPSRGAEHPSLSSPSASIPPLRAFPPFPTPRCCSSLFSCLFSAAFWVSPASANVLQLFPFPPQARALSFPHLLSFSLPFEIAMVKNASWENKTKQKNTTGWREGAGEESEGKKTV